MTDCDHRNALLFKRVCEKCSFLHKKIDNTNNPVWIGNEGYQSNKWGGMLDEVAIFNVALTENDINVDAGISAIIEEPDKILGVVFEMKH